MKYTLLALILGLSLSAQAANAVRVDAKKVLNVTEGDYKVVKSDSGFESEKICNDGDIHTIEWAGSQDDPVLKIGAAATFYDFNAGLSAPETKPYYAHKCSNSRSTQALAGQLQNHVYRNCDDGNTTTVETFVFKAKTIEYSSKMTVAHKGKAVVVTSTCTLQLLPKK